MMLVCLLIAMREREGENEQAVQERASEREGESERAGDKKRSFSFGFASYFTKPDCRWKWRVSAPRNKPSSSPYSDFNSYFEVLGSGWLKSSEALILTVMELICIDKSRESANWMDNIHIHRATNSIYWSPHSGSTTRKVENAKCHNIARCSRTAINTQNTKGTVKESIIQRKVFECVRDRDEAEEVGR